MRREWSIRAAMMAATLMAAGGAAAETLEPVAELSALEAAGSRPGHLLALDDVRFEPHRATLAPGNPASLDRLVQLLRSQPSRRVVIQGHTDAEGPAAFNLELSKLRAEKVRQALLARGIAPERVIAHGYGALLPVADNATAAGRQRNRRIEAVLLAD